MNIDSLAILTPSSRHAAGSGAENPPNSPVQISKASSIIQGIAFVDGIKQLNPAA